MVAERIPSEGSERARGLGSEVGERLGKSTGARLRGRGEAQRERGGSEGMESLVAWRLRAWRARGVQGAYSVHACAVQSA